MSEEPTRGNLKGEHGLGLQRIAATELAKDRSSNGQSKGESELTLRRMLDFELMLEIEPKSMMMRLGWVAEGTVGNRPMGWERGCLWETKGVGGRAGPSRSSFARL